MSLKYDIQLSKGAVRDLKKMDPALRDFMYNRIYEIGENPYQNEKLSGPYNELRSQHSRYKGVDYRAIYYVNEKGKLVIIALIGTRENIYKELARRL